MLHALRCLVDEQRFFPTWLGLLTNPLYISRRGLASGVRRYAGQLQGDVMDFGCGSKPYQRLFAHCASYTGVDLAVSGHDHASSRVDVFYDGRTLPFPDGHFDSIVAFEVLEHVFTPDETLAELLRVLKPGGKLLVSVPFGWNEHEVPYDFARYTSFGLVHILQKAGFRVQDLHKTNSFVLAIAQLSIEYLSKDVVPGGALWRTLAKLFVFFPMTLAAYVLDAVLPRRDSFFGNCMVLAARA